MREGRSGPLFWETGDGAGRQGGGRCRQGASRSQADGHFSGIAGRIIECRGVGAAKGSAKARLLAKLDAVRAQAMREAEGDGIDAAFSEEVGD